MSRLLPRLFFIAVLVAALLFLPDYGKPRDPVRAQNPFERNLYVEAHRGLEGQQ